MNTKDFANAFTKENLLKALSSDDPQVSAAAERTLGVCKYPENYWIMPDYYYPGMRYNLSNTPLFNNSPEKHKARLDETTNGRILTTHLFLPENKREYKRCKPKENVNDIYDIRFREDEVIVVTNEKDEVVEIPWVVFCGMFLKARELGYSRPSELDLVGPKDEKTKEKWLANQEKIKELQSKID